MLNNVINIILILFFIYYFFKSFNKSIQILFIFMLVAPNFIIGSIIVPFYIVSFAILFVLGILFKTNSIIKFKVSELEIFLLMIFFYLVSNSLIHLMLGFYDEYNWLSLYAYIRFVVLYFIMKNMQKENFDSFITPVLIINLLVTIYQVIFPQQIGLFYQLYGKPSYTVLETYYMNGAFGRPTGTLLSPLILGAFSVLCFGYYITAKNISKTSYKIIASVVLGLLSMSKTAIIGLSLLFIIKILSGNINKKIIYSSIVLLVMLLIISSLYSYLNPDLIAQYNYYLNFLFKPLDALETRYNSSGNVTEYYSVVKDHIIFGLGDTRVGDMRVVDSLYVATIAEGGLILLISYLLWLWRTSYNFLVFVSILLCGVGGSYFFSIFLLPFICCSKKKSIRNNVVDEV